MSSHKSGSATGSENVARSWKSTLEENMVGNDVLLFVGIYI